MGDGNPRYPLDINGDIRLTGSIVNGNGQVLSLVPPESLWTIGNSNLSYTGGNVGIGTTSPETLLTVGNHAFTDGTRDLLRFPSYRHNEAFTIRNNDDPTNGRLEFFWGNSQNGSGGHDNTVDKSILTLRHDGNVGIGTTGPNCKLDVNGQIRGGYNTDTLSYFGRTWVGVVGGLTDHAGIGHIDNIGNGEYALMQASSGKTYLGSVSGQSIGFRIGNSDKMELNLSLIHI